MYLVLPKKVTQVFKITIFFLLLILSPIVANAASMSVSPATGSFEVGDRLTLRIVISSNAPFNAVSGVISYPSIFSVDSVSKIGSALNFWVTEPIVLKNSSTIKFEGVALGGYMQSSGTVITMNLRAVKAGSGTFSFQSGQILANDGEGTDITGNLIGATLSVIEGTTPPPTKPSITVPVEEVDEEIPQPKPTLNAPEIVFKSKFGDEVILGKSDYPNTQALVTFMAVDGSKVFIVDATDSSGEFSVLIPSSLKRGAYSVSAVIVKPDKTNSETSNTILIQVGSIFSDITKEVWGLIGLLVAAILYLLVRTYFHFKKEKNIHQVIKKEIVEAEDVLHKSFDILREDVIDYDNKKLTPTEHKRMAEFRKDIDSAEKVITKELDDVR